jgi:hypothetical protein
MRQIVVIAAISLFIGLASYGASPGQSIADHPSFEVTLGAFTFELPLTWKPFRPDEMDALRKQFQAQSKEIYQRYSGGVADPSSLENSRRLAGIV